MASTEHRFEKEELARRGDAIEQYLLVAELVGEQEHQARVEFRALLFGEAGVRLHHRFVESIGIGNIGIEVQGA